MRSVRLGGAEFDADTGGLRRLHGLEVSGPALELWRGPTDNDRSGERGSYELGDPDQEWDGAPGPSSEQRWRERGLDRLVTRVVDVAAAQDEIVVATRVGAANNALSVDVTYRWWAEADDAVGLRVEINPTPTWDCTWPRVGVRVSLPVAVDHAAWFGTGPAESYPDSVRAARVGRFAASVDDLNVRYSRPQETGHRGALRNATLSTGGTPCLVVDTLPGIGGHRPGFTLTRHTPHELDRARHPYELPGPTATHLYLDAAVHGLGSRACGFDVLPRHALWPGARSFAVVFARA